MKISLIQRQLELYAVQLDNLQHSREETYRKQVEKKHFDQVQLERVARNIRMGSDKGRHVDVEC